MDKMRSSQLEMARKIEKRGMSEIPVEQRPVYHLSSPVLWMNDPNGFSYYQGRYHLFIREIIIYFSSIIHLVIHGDLCTGDIARAGILLDGNICQ